MELEKALSEKGVATLEELEEKVRKEALESAQATNQEAIGGLKKQIEDLEKIKGTQSVEVGDLRKQLEKAEEEKMSLAEKVEKFQEKPEDDSALKQKEEEYRKQNEAREQSLSDEHWTALDEALKSAPEDVRKLATTTEEGRAAFMESVLGKPEAGETPSQETFRRPAKEEKLSISEQIARGLGQATKQRRPGAQLAGSGFNPNRERAPASVPTAQQYSGGLSSRIRQHKEKG